MPGIRTPVFLSAGIVRLPFRKFLLADVLYAIPGVNLIFWLAYVADRHSFWLLLTRSRVTGNWRSSPSCRSSPGSSRPRSSAGRSPPAARRNLPVLGKPVVTIANPQVPEIKVGDTPVMDGRAHPHRPSANGPPGGPETRSRKTPGPAPVSMSRPHDAGGSSWTKERPHVGRGNRRSRPEPLWRTSPRGTSPWSRRPLDSSRTTSASTAPTWPSRSAPPRTTRPPCSRWSLPIDESGWPWRVERVGAPGVAERYDYPLPEHAHYLALRGLLRLTGDRFLAFNLWCLLSYPLTAVCALAVFRALGVSRPVGFALAARLHVPAVPRRPGVLAHDARLLPHGPTRPPADDLDSARPAAVLHRGRRGRPPAPLAIQRDDGMDGAPWRPSWPSTSPYYAFFGCFFLVVAVCTAACPKGHGGRSSAGVGTAAIRLRGRVCVCAAIRARTAGARGQPGGRPAAPERGRRLLSEGDRTGPAVRRAPRPVRSATSPGCTTPNR